MFGPCTMSIEDFGFKKDLPDFIKKKNWQLIEVEGNRAYWRSIKGARVELFPCFIGVSVEHSLPAVLVRPDGKSQNFTGEDCMERAWTVAEMFRKQKQ